MRPPLRLPFLESGLCNGAVSPQFSPFVPTATLFFPYLFVSDTVLSCQEAICLTFHVIKAAFRT